MSSVIELFTLYGIFLLLFYVVIKYILNILLFERDEQFPGPLSLPLIGSAHYFVGNTQNLLQKIMELLYKYPSPFRLSFANKFMYVIHEPEHLKTILTSTKTLEKNEFYDFFKPWLGTSLLISPEEKWRVHRKLISPTFHSSILKSYVEIFSARSIALNEVFADHLNKDEFEISHYISLCTLNIICETVMGIDISKKSETSSEYINATKRVLKAVTKRMQLPWLHFDYIYNQTKLAKECQKSIQYLHNFILDVIIEKKEESQAEGISRFTNGIEYITEKKRKKFLDLMIELSKDGNILTNDELREEVQVMMFAGTDTTAITNSFVMLMIASHPEIQEKVYKELYDIYNDVDPSILPVSHEDLNRMEYLERVIKETMRLFPISPILFRRLSDDLELGKYKLIKGGTVVLGFIRVHRNEKYWKDPLRFNPDRFLPEECTKRHPFTYLPFSGGPRNCIGMKYAMMSMKTMIATIIRRFKLIKDNALPIEDIKLKLDTVINTCDPIKIRIEERTREINEVKR